MLDNIGQTAIRSLGVDIANLTTRLAVAQAAINEILLISNALDLNSWRSEPLFDGQMHEEESPYTLMLPGPEADKVQELLMVLRQLQAEV